MAKFLFIYRESTESHARPSPEQMKALGADWYAWIQKISSAIVTGGDGLQHSARASETRDRSTLCRRKSSSASRSSTTPGRLPRLQHTGRLVKAGLVTDGPYVEAEEIIVSFGIMQADDYDAAVEIARECPGDMAIEIRELAGYA